LDHYGDWANLSHSNTVVQESILWIFISAETFFFYKFLSSHNR
jgi:hypothetical protein